MLLTYSKSKFIALEPAFCIIQPERPKSTLEPLQLLPPNHPDSPNNHSDSDFIRPRCPCTHELQDVQCIVNAFQVPLPNPGQDLASKSGNPSAHLFPNTDVSCETQTEKLKSRPATKARTRIDTQKETARIMPNEHSRKSDPQSI